MSDARLTAVALLVAFALGTVLGMFVMVAP